MKIKNWEKLSDKQKDNECIGTRNKIVCPFCGYVDEDLDEYRGDISFDFICGECGEEFHVDVSSVDYYFDSYKGEDIVKL